MLVLMEWNKLYYVSFSNFSALTKSGEEENIVIIYPFLLLFLLLSPPNSQAFIGIQYVHVLEVCCAHSHNDNGHWQTGCSDDSLHCLPHV